jgi:DNA-binding NarL/FixJ family response regulator
VGSVDELDQLDTAWDMVILDLPSPSEPGGSGVEVISRLARTGYPLVISAWDRPPTLLSAIRAGARGCVSSQSDQATVTAAVHTVAHGGFYLCRSLVDGFYAQLSQPAHADPYGLARREVETLRWIVRGLTHAQIATKMGLSRATINTYAKRIRGKLNVSSTAELTRMAIELGYLTAERRDHPAA